MKYLYLFYFLFKSSETKVRFLFSSILYDKTAAESDAQNVPSETMTQQFSGFIIRRLTACTRIPHRGGNSMGRALLFKARIRNGRQKMNSCPNLESNQKTDPRSGMPSTKLSLYPQFWVTGASRIIHEILPVSQRVRNRLKTLSSHVKSNLLRHL